MMLRAARAAAASCSRLAGVSPASTWSRSRGRPNGGRRCDDLELGGSRRLAGAPPASTWYAAAFDPRTRAPVLASPGAAGLPEVPSVVELFAELEAAAFHFAEVVPPPRRARWRQRRHRRRGRPAVADELGQRYRGAWRAALLHAFPSNHSATGHPPR
jgi:hypothetical protein